MDPRTSAACLLEPSASSGELVEKHKTPCHRQRSLEGPQGLRFDAALHVFTMVSLLLPEWPSTGFFFCQVGPRSA